jgi:hypothetical protein
VTNGYGGADNWGYGGPSPICPNDPPEPARVTPNYVQWQPPPPRPAPATPLPSWPARTALVGSLTWRPPQGAGPPGLSLVRTAGSPKGLSARIKAVLGTIILLATAWCAVGCLQSRRPEAEALERQIRSLPGVAGTELAYSATFENGNDFGLVVRLDPSITTAQAGDVDRTFADKTGRGFGDHKLELDLRYPSSSPPSLYNPEYSQATFTFDRSTGGVNPSAAQRADSTGVWLHALRAPVAQQVWLGQPTWGGKADSREIRIILRPDAASADAQRLQDSDPALAHAHWQLSLVADKTFRPHEYDSTPAPPTDAVIALWHQFSTLVGAGGHASGSTQLPVVAPRRAQTEIEFSTPSGSGSEVQARSVAMAGADLARRFGSPVALTIRTGEGSVLLVVGGCWQHDQKQIRLPLELEMSRLYERC